MQKHTATHPAACQLAVHAAVKTGVTLEKVLFGREKRQCATADRSQLHCRRASLCCAQVHIQNATLAGGVAIGSAANLVIGPGGALAVGVGAGLLSTCGYAYLMPRLEAAIGLRDTCGVHNLHGMPGVLGGLVAALVAVVAPDANAPVMKFASRTQARMALPSSCMILSKLRLSHSLPRRKEPRLSSSPSKTVIRALGHRRCSRMCPPHRPAASTALQAGLLCPAGRSAPVSVPPGPSSESRCVWLCRAASRHAHCCGG